MPIWAWASIEPSALMPPRPPRVWGVFVPISRWALGRKLPSGAGGPLSSVGSSVGTVAGWTLQRGFPADDRGGARLSLEESRRKEHQGGRVSSSLDPPFLVGGTLRGPPSFFAWPAAHNPTPVTARPPAGRAGRSGFADGEGPTRIEFKNSTKKRPKSGHVHGHRNSPSTETMRHIPQNERVAASGP